MVKINTSRNKSANQIVLYLLLAVLLAGLIIYSAKGIYSRYAQDDYCYGYHVRTFGFFDTQFSSYWQQNEYNGNRYSATLIHGLIEVLGGPKVSPLIPVTLIILWTISIYWVAFQLLPSAEQNHKKIIALLMACFVVFYTFYLAPNMYEILYWNPGQQAYLMPMFLFTGFSALLIWFTKFKKYHFTHYLIIAVLCVFAGGFSETPTFWFLMVLLLGVLFSVLKKRSLFGHSENRKLLLIAVMTTVLVVVILGVSPSNGTRLSDENRSSLIEVIQTSLLYGFDFLYNTVRSAPLPYIMLAAFGYYIAGFFENITITSVRHFLVLAAAGLGVLYVLSATTMFPTMFATGVYPGYRALTPIHFSLVVYCILLGWWSERVVCHLVQLDSKKNLHRIMSSLIGIVLVVYSVRAGIFIVRDFELYQARAAGWDQREVIIFDAREMGETKIQVPAFDSVYGITELKSDSGNWVNRCAAKYYGVESITATENYLGFGTYPIGK